MNLTFLLLLIGFVHVSATTLSQTVSINVKNRPIGKVFEDIEKQTDLMVVYNDRFVNSTAPVSIEAKNLPLEDVLELLLNPISLNYHITENTIVISKATPDSKGNVKILATAEIQQRMLTGVITDTQGNPLEGATVSIKGTSAVTRTNKDGKYELSIAQNRGSVLVTMLGFGSAERIIGNQSIINITLNASMDDLDEVVVVGYGTQKKRNLTGSIVSVGSDEISKTSLQDPISILQGRAAGVQVTSNSGAPGGEMTIRVRGNSSLNSGNSPLFIVDGVPIESNSISSLNGSENFGLSPLAAINPSDIASIEVLKDAASTAIYGSRAANGVVMITTKRGVEGKATVDFNFTTGFSELTRKLSVLNATQYRSAIMDSYLNMDKPEEPYWTILDSLSPMNNGDVDWQSELMRSAAQYKGDIAIRGGNDKVQYAWSTSYMDQDGIILNSNYKRITSRLNLDFNVTDRFRVGQSISYTNGVNNRINAGGVGNLSVIRELLVRPPIMSMYLPDGSLNGYSLGRRNPVGIAKYATHLNKSNRIIASQYVEYKVLDDLTFRSNLNLDYTAMKEDEFMPSILDYRENYNTGGVRNTNNLTWGNETFLRYNKIINQDHNIGGLLGMSIQNWKYDRTGLNGMFFPSDNIRTLNAAGTISNKDSNGADINAASEHAMLSYFGRASYDYQGKYLGEVNLRADGSSRFGRQNRFGYFPSASVGWRFSQEGFLQNAGFLTDGKFRFSIGKTGNEAIGDYTSQGEFMVGVNYGDLSGAAPTVMPNEALTWESTTQYNAGLDLSFFANRLTLNADYYVKNTRDLLYSVPIPSTTGFAVSVQNIGKIENKGFEFILATKNIVKDKFQWSTSLNISTNRNKVVSLPKELLTNGYIQNGTYHILKEGLPIGTFYGWRFDGVYASDADNVNGITHKASGPVFKGGDPIWHDLNNDKIINQDDRQIIGQAEPDFLGGISNDFTYKNFTLNVFFQFSSGNDIYSEINHQRNAIVRYNNLSTDALGRWRKQGDITNYPKPVRDDPMETDSRVQSRWVEDGSYIKLKNVNLSYAVPQSLVNRFGLRKLDAFVTASNLITWTKYTGFDPDVNSYSGLRVGVDEGSYPQSRMFIFGLSIGF